MNPQRSFKKTVAFLLLLLGCTGVVFSSAFAFYRKDTAQSEDEQPAASREKPLSPQRASSPHTAPGSQRGPITPGGPEKQAHGPRYAPGVILVKFKDAAGATLDRALEPKGLQVNPAQTGLGSLSVLNLTHRVKRMKPVFPALKAKQLTSRKTAAQLAQEIKTKFPRRAKRAPQGVTSPNLANIYRLELEDTTADVLDLCQLYKQDPNVEYAQPNYLHEAYWIPNDRYYASSNSWGQGYDDLWGLKKLQLEPAWALTQGQGVVVAVVDTGVDYTHPDLTANIWTNPNDPPGDIPDSCDRVAHPGIALADDDCNGFVDDTKGWDFANNDNEPMDHVGHGTHVAGTIAAVGNNGLGIVGVAPQARIMPVKGFDDLGNGYSDWLANALVYAAQNGADVINNSWGCVRCVSNPVVEEAVRTAYGLGAVVVFAAGNFDDDLFWYSPQNMTNPKPIIVASTDHLDQRTDFSNVGLLLDVAAPGGESGPPCSDFLHESILSLRAAGTDLAAGCGPNWINQMVVGTNYYRMRGTSMAAPHAAGVAALVLAHQPSFTNEEVRQALRASADDIGSPGFDAFTGAGRLNADRALRVQSIPRIKITNPPARSIVNSRTAGTLTITGTAAGPTFKQYELAYAALIDLNTWTSIGRPSVIPVDNNTLGTWRIASLTPGLYMLRLLVTTSDGLQFQEMVEVGIEAYNFIQITTDPRYDLQPVISDNRIVWHDLWRDGTENLYFCLYNPATHACEGERKIGQVRTSLGNPHLAISGDRVVWQDNRNGNWDIYLYDLSHPERGEQQITTDSHGQRSPAISGDRVVWLDDRNGNTDIYLCTYNPARQTCEDERQITTNPAAQAFPAISGDRVVWQDSRNGDGNTDIYLCTYNPARQTCEDERQMTNNRAWQYDPHISGKWVVWKDLRNSTTFPTPDIYAYNLDTNTEIAITISAGAENSNISGNLVVWQDSSEDISLVDLNPERHPPVLASIGDKTIDEGRPLTFQVSATDPDGDPLTFSMTGLPPEAQARLTPTSPTTATFSWTPGYLQAGTYRNVHFEVSDGIATASEDITITVNKAILGVWGKITDQGNGTGLPFAGVTVELTSRGELPRSTATDAAGLYAFGGLLPRKHYHLRPLRPPGYRIIPSSKWIHLARPPGSRDLIVHFRARRR